MRCDCTWTGFRTSHCPICHKIFSSNEVGDYHRVGPYEPKGQRRCRTDDEMRAKGFVQNERGWWGTGHRFDASVVFSSTGNTVMS